MKEITKKLPYIKKQLEIISSCANYCPIIEDTKCKEPKEKQAVKNLWKFFHKFVTVPTLERKFSNGNYGYEKILIFNKSIILKQTNYFNKNHDFICTKYKFIRPTETVKILKSSIRQIKAGIGFLQKGLKSNEQYLKRFSTKNK